MNGRRSSEVITFHRRIQMVYRGSTVTIQGTFWSQENRRPIYSLSDLRSQECTAKSGSCSLSPSFFSQRHFWIWAEWPPKLMNTSKKGRSYTMFLSVNFRNSRQKRFQKPKQAKLLLQSSRLVIQKPFSSSTSIKQMNILESPTARKYMIKY